MTTNPTNLPTSNNSATQPSFDDQGFLTDPQTWTETLAAQIAHQEAITLTPEHLEILRVARAFYTEYGFSPSIRPLSKYIAMELDVAKGRSIYLMQLFPGSPAKLVSKLAGLPKPKNCL